MSNTVKTPKGTVLPLISLKGKDYLQVAHRLQWFNEVAERFRIETDFIQITDDQTVARAKVIVFNKEGLELNSATATKRETKKDFSDHTEKAETGAIGRALALLGFGTQFALSDLDEGSRLADSPVTNVKKAEGLQAVAPTVENITAIANTVPTKISTFRKPKTAPVAEKAVTTDGWE